MRKNLLLSIVGTSVIALSGFAAVNNVNANAAKTHVSKKAPVVKKSFRGQWMNKQTGDRFTVKNSNKVALVHEGQKKQIVLAKDGKGYDAKDAKMGMKLGKATQKDKNHLVLNLVTGQSEVFTRVNNKK